MTYKHLFISLAVSVMSLEARSQNTIITETYQFNDFRWHQTTALQLFYNKPLSLAGLETPAFSGNHTIFISSLWMGGIDQNDIFRGVGILYDCDQEDAEFCEYIPGPVRLDGTADSEGAYFESFNRYWLVTGFQVESHLAYFDCLNDPGCDEEMQYPDGYEAPESFLSWPAHGDTENGFAAQLAPFIDVDENGTYNPENGDYPDFCGDFCTYLISNDAASPHSFSQTEPLGFEIHTMVYGYESASEALTNTLFVQHKLINRSENSYTDMYIGSWNDFDIGNPNNDFIGTDVRRSMIYGYNGSLNDEASTSGPGYGSDLPAMGVRVVQGTKQPQNNNDDPAHSSEYESYGNQSTGWGDGIIDNERLGLRSSMYHNTASGPAATFQPGIGTEMYQYLQGNWRDGTQLTYGGTGYNPTTEEYPAQYLFPGNSDPLFIGTGGEDPNYFSEDGWSEEAENNPPGDRRMLASTGPFELAPGESDYINYAFIFARDSYDADETPIETLQRFADEVVPFACQPPDDIVLSNSESTSALEKIKVFPNPVATELSIELPERVSNATVSLHDSAGRLCDSFSINQKGIATKSIDLPSGVYIVTIRTESNTWSEKLIVQP